jgi:hypothetical protein
MRIPTNEGYEELKHLDSFYENYSKAMSRRRPESVLEEDRFSNYMYDAWVYVCGQSACVGQYENNIFIPTHFCPSSIKEGYKMIKEMKKFSNVVFAITEDLKPMLKKCGYICLPFRVKKEFRGELVDKYICISSPKVFLHFCVDKMKSLYKRVIGWVSRVKDSFKEKIKINLFKREDTTVVTAINPAEEELEDI